jgi:hypothetical protein
MVLSHPSSERSRSLIAAAAGELEVLSLEIREPVVFREAILVCR